MNVETELCKRVAALMKERLYGFEIHGNHLEDSEIAGAEVYEARRLDVTVGARSYGGYSSPVAEITVNLDGEIKVEDDTGLGETLDAYEALVSLLEEWQRSIVSVKRDLTLACFAPYGLKVNGGQPLEIDRETKTRRFHQQFTINGRVGNV